MLVAIYANRVVADACLLVLCNAIGAQQNTQKPPAAIGILRTAAERGDVISQFSLAMAYMQGRALRQDYAEALKWYRKAADHGLAEAQYNLGAMYFNGTGVTQDHAEALKWFRMAADQGNASAQASLGLMYFRGDSVIRDYAQAYMWANLSAGLEEKKREALAELWNELAKKITPRQIAEAERLAREWKLKWAK
jgi:uncharacterized protein